MVRAEDDGDAAAPAASTDIRGSTVLDDENLYDGVSKNVDDEEELDAAIEELTEERYVSTFCCRRMTMGAYLLHVRCLFFVVCALFAQNNNASCSIGKADDSLIAVHGSRRCSREVRWEYDD